MVILTCQPQKTKNSQQGWIVDKITNHERKWLQDDRNVGGTLRAKKRSCWDHECSGREKSNKFKKKLLKPWTAAEHNLKYWDRKAVKYLDRNLDATCFAW